MDGAIKKVIVIGLDGLEPEIVSRLLEAGQLPNLARLKEQGGFARVATTRPAQTPVAWSTFATGTNPGRPRHLRLPPPQSQELSARPGPEPLRAEERLPAAQGRQPPAAARRSGSCSTAAGTRLDRSALPVHLSARPDPRPDALGHGRPRPPRRARHLDVLHHRSPRPRPARARTSSGPSRRRRRRVLDPPDRPAQPQGGGDLRVEIDAQRRSATAGGSSFSPTARPGSWRSARAAGATGCGSSSRSGCSSRSAGWSGSTSSGCEPELALYASPVNFDPDSPLFPISDPPEYAGDLAREIGLFYTTGMVEDHAGLNNERISEAGVPRPVRDRLARARGDDAPRARACSTTGSSTASSTRPTASSTCSGGSREPDHPANRGAAARSRLRPGHRRRLSPLRRDRRQGPRVSPTTRRWSSRCRDHGFNSFRRGVHLNTWLLRQRLSGPARRGRARRRGRRPAPPGRLGADPGLCRGPGRDLPEPQGPRRAGDRPGRGGRGAQGRAGATG